MTLIFLCGHGLLGGSSSSAVLEGTLSLMEGIDEGISIFEERNLSELVAAEDGELAVHDNTLTADIEASWAARIREVHCRGDITTAHWVQAERAADGAAETGTISLLAETLIEVVDLNVIVDLTARTAADAALEGRGKVDLNTVLVDLNIGVVIDLRGLAEETRAGVHDTLNAEASLHLLRERSVVHDADAIRISGVESSTGAGCRHQGALFSHL